MRIKTWFPSVRFTSTQPVQSKESGRLYVHTRTASKISYPVISVVWDESIAEYPEEYIAKCIEAFERFDFPEEIYERYKSLFDLQDKVQQLLEEISETRRRARLNSAEGPVS